MHCHSPRDAFAATRDNCSAYGYQASSGANIHRGHTWRDGYWRSTNGYRQCPRAARSP